MRAPGGGPGHFLVANSRTVSATEKRGSDPVEQEHELEAAGSEDVARMRTINKRGPISLLDTIALMRFRKPWTPTVSRKWAYRKHRWSPCSRADPGPRHLEVETAGRGGATLNLPGETEAGNAGTQPCRGIAWRAHRDDERQRRNLVLTLLPNPHRIERPQCLENPRQ
jgi:hypothetical protein